MTKFILIGINVLKIDLQQKNPEKMKTRKKIETKYQQKGLIVINNIDNIATVTTNSSGMGFIKKMIIDKQTQLTN